MDASGVEMPGAIAHFVTMLRFSYNDVTKCNHKLLYSGWVREKAASPQSIFPDFFFVLVCSSTEYQQRMAPQHSALLTSQRPVDPNSGSACFDLVSQLCVVACWFMRWYRPEVNRQKHVFDEHHSTEHLCCN